MKYSLLLLFVTALFITGCTVQESNKNIDTATEKTKQAVDATGEGLKSATGSVIEGSSDAANATKAIFGEGIGSAVDTAKDAASLVEGRMDAMDEVLGQ